MTTQDKHTTRTDEQSFFHGRTEFVMVGILLVVAAVLFFGSLNMEILGQSIPGPDFTPLLVAGLLVIAAILLAIDIIRNPELDDDIDSGQHNFSPDMLHDLAGMSEDEDTFLHHEEWDRLDAGEKKEAIEIATSDRKVKHRSDWSTLAGVIASLVIFLLILNVAGWVISAGLLFFAIAYFLGSRKPLFDLAVGFIFSSVIQLVFSGLLELTLPNGIFGG